VGLNVIGFRSELEDGTFWVFEGKAVGIGVGGGGADVDQSLLKLQLRWPNPPGASLGGDCFFSAIHALVGDGFAGIVMWDSHRTVGTLWGLSFGAGVSVMPIGVGHFRQADSFDG
jgi:hypothetical protein